MVDDVSSIICPFFYDGTSYDLYDFCWDFCTIYQHLCHIVISERVVRSFNIQLYYLMYLYILWMTFKYTFLSKNQRCLTSRPSTEQCFFNWRDINPIPLKYKGSTTKRTLLTYCHTPLITRKAMKRMPSKSSK